MNTKTIFLSFAILFVTLNVCSGATKESRNPFHRQKRQFGQPTVVNAQSTATNLGNGGVASSTANAQNTQLYSPSYGGSGYGLGGGFGNPGGFGGPGFGGGFGGFGK